MLVRHVMSSEVYALPPELTAIEALRALRERRIRRAPLLDAEGHLVGFVTERDLLRATPGTVAEVQTPAGRAACARPVLQLARRDVVQAHPDDHAEDLALVFLRRRIGGVPVVERGRVVGVVTETDLFRVLVGGAHLADAERVTVQRGRAVTVDSPLEVVRELGLTLAGLTEYPGPDGRAIHVLRVRGARAGALGQALTQAGWVLLDRRGAAGSAHRRAG